MEGQEGMLVGDVLLAAAFVSYAGPFNMAFRQQLVGERWLPDIIERGIPLSAGEGGWGRGLWRRRCEGPAGLVKGARLLHPR
jgi:hypothetical protein